MIHDGAGGMAAKRTRSERLARRLRLFDPARYVSAGAWLPELRTVRDRRGVALTFDDGPTGATTPEVLALLREYSAQATFFVSGVRAAQRPELVESIASDGHDVYSHGWDHRRYDEGPPTSVVEAVERCEKLLAKFRLTPSPYLLRLPYTAGHRNVACHRALARWRPDVRFVHYSATFTDWLLAAGCNSREETQMRVTRALDRAPIARLGGKIVLLHELAFDGEALGVSPARSAETTVMLLGGLLERLRRAGLTTVKLTPAPGPSALTRFFLAPRLTMIRVGAP